MSPSSASALPGTRSLAAFHVERAELYAVVASLLGCPVGFHPPDRLRARAGVSTRAREALDRTLAEPGLAAAQEVFASRLAVSLETELETLTRLARLAGSCASYLRGGDLAAAADLWDEQWSLVQGEHGRRLMHLVAHLEAESDAALGALGRALRALLEEDVELLGASGTP